MNREQAKQILLLYRPQVDAGDPAFAPALAEVNHDPELRAWFENHCAFQTAMRDKLREIAPPQFFKERILAEAKMIRPVAWWRRTPALAAAAAALVVLVSLIGALLTRPTANQFASFQGRMVGTALREYRMDIETNDLNQVRQLMVERGAPADFELPKGLSQMELAGGGFLRWQNNPVAMVCFRRPDRKMLYLFVVKKSVLHRPPPADPHLETVREMQALSWTRGDKAYLLASPQDPDLRTKAL